MPLTDYLSSTNNEVSPSDVAGPIFGDSGPRPQPGKLNPGGSAGVAIAAVVVAIVLAAVGYFVGYKRLWLERRSKHFHRFDDAAAHITHSDAAAVAAAVEGLSPR